MATETDENEWEVDSAASGKDRYCKGEEWRSRSQHVDDSDSSYLRDGTGLCKGRLEAVERKGSRTTSRPTSRTTTSRRIIASRTVESRPRTSRTTTLRTTTSRTSPRTRTSITTPITTISSAGLADTWFRRYMKEDGENLRNTGTFRVLILPSGYQGRQYWAFASSRIL